MLLKLTVTDGNKFKDMNSFYDEIQKKFCPDLKGSGSEKSREESSATLRPT